MTYLVAAFAKKIFPFQTVNSFSFGNNNLFICLLLFSAARPSSVEVYFCEAFPDLGTALDDSQYFWVFPLLYARYEQLCAW